MFKHLSIFVFLLLGLNAFSQPGANNSQGELISKVYFGTLPYDGTDIMNPPVGLDLLPCTGYSDYTIGNNNSVDGNTTGSTFFTGVLRDETYELEVEGGFCAPLPNISNANRSIKVYIDYDGSDSFEATELVYTSPYSNDDAPIFNTSITIPNTAVLGQINMRIVYNRVQNSTPLWAIDAFPWANSTFTYGETEDYSLLVIGYMDSVSATNTSCFDNSDGQIQIYPNATSTPTAEYSINGLAGPWTTNLIYTGLPAGSYDVWSRDSDLAPNYVYEQLETIVNNSDTVFANPLVTSDYNGTDVSCNGALDGEISLFSSGGDASSYTYQYSSTTNPAVVDALANPLTALSADTYTIIATDAQGCSSLPTEITVIEPQALTIDNVIINQPPSCNSLCDAVIEVEVSGGTMLYNFSVDGTDNGNNNIITNVCSGNPLLTVTDINNCFVQSNPLIPNPTGVDLISNITSNYLSYDVSCQDSSNGSIELSASGGTGGEYSFSIDGGLTYPYTSSGILEISSLGTEAFTVIAVDSNLCESLPQEFSLTAPTPLSFDFITVSAAIKCNGFDNGEISVQAIDGVGNYLYSTDGGLTTQSSGVFNNLPSASYEVTVIDDNNCTYQESILLNQPDALSISSATVSSDFNGSELSCFGASDGALTVDFIGGTPPYNYNLAPDPTLYPLAASNIIPNLSAGIQTLIAVDDNGCVSPPLDFEINEPNALLISNINLVSNVSCFGGSDGEMIITATGGTGAYTYLVDVLYNSSNQAPYTVNELSASTYNIVVSDINNCTSLMVPQAIIQPTQLSPNLSVVNLGCEGEFGSAAVNVSGGTPNYNIVWSNGVTGASADQLNSGGYSVTITDALNCQEVIDFQITEPNISLAVSPILCNGNNSGEILATLNNPNPSSIYTVLWNDANAQTTYNAVGLASGLYTITISDQFGCELSVSESIVEPDSLNVFVEHTQLCPDLPTASVLVYASGGLVPYSYLWSTNEQSELISIQTPGSYSIQVTDYNGCQQDFGFTIDPISNVQLDFITQGVSCIDNSDGSVEVFPTGGYSPYTFSWSNYTYEALNLGVSSGIYGLSVTDNNACEYFQEVEVPSSDQSCVTAYSAFSPNGDQNNDYWHIDNIELYPDALVEVFNRWGDRVYSTKRYINAWQGAWQGMYNSAPLPSATYYYVITLNNDEEPIAGTVTIVR